MLTKNPTICYSERLNNGHKNTACTKEWSVGISMKAFTVFCTVHLQKKDNNLKNVMKNTPIKRNFYCEVILLGT